MVLRSLTKRDLGRTPLAVLLLLALASVVFSGVLAGERIVSMADIHGNYASATALLRKTGLIDDEARWVGGKTTFVQTGDYTDRGPEVRRVMDLLMDLEEQAQKAGGRAVVLIGNHEIMNIIGELVDVTEADYASFVDSRSEDRRQDAYEDFLKFEKRRAEKLDLPSPAPTPETEAAWMAAHPPGFVEHREAFSSKGRYGKWLRELPVIAKEEDVIFMHAGINPLLSEISIKDLNARVQEELRAFDQYKQYLVDRELALPFFTLGELIRATQDDLEKRRARIARETAAEEEEDGKTYSPPRDEQNHMNVLETILGMGSWLIIHEDGVLWYRGFAQWNEVEGAAGIEKLLDAYDADHFVVGHTPQVGGRIQSRFDGKIFLADTGMLSSVYRGGQASALEFQDGAIRAIYLDRDPVQLYPSAH